MTPHFTRTGCPVVWGVFDRDEERFTDDRAIATGFVDSRAAELEACLHMGDDWYLTVVVHEVEPAEDMALSPGEQAEYEAAVAMRAEPAVASPAADIPL